MRIYAQGEMFPDNVLYVKIFFNVRQVPNWEARRIFCRSDSLHTENDKGGIKQPKLKTLKCNAMERDLPAPRHCPRLRAVYNRVYAGHRIGLSP